MTPKSLIVLWLVLFANAVVLLMFGTPAQARPMSVTITVNDTNDLIDDNLADGICRTVSNSCTLRAAIMQANALGGPHTINLPAGVFGLTIAGASENNAVSGDLDIRSNLNIVGAGSASTIINGNQIDRVFEIHDSFQVSLTGITIQNGTVEPYEAGGGIRNAGILTLASCVLTNNFTNSEGGGLYNANTVSFNGVTVINNRAGGGGGVWNAGTLGSSNSLVTNNTSRLHGGGVVSTGSLNMSNTLVSHNIVTETNGFGGGLTNIGSAVLSNVSVFSNTTFSSAGGIANGGTLTMTDSTISGNQSGYGAGIFSNGLNVWLFLNSSTINNNTATITGGGISNGGNAVLRNVTVSGNRAQFLGGGIENGRFITLTNVTIRHNMITGTRQLAASVYNGYNQGSLVYLKNTIIAENAFVGNCVTEPGTSILTLGNNLSNDNSCGLTGAGDLPNTNPLLGSLANNGGATQTHALLAGSPAINAGDNTACPATDQRGYSRISVCDIGAYEYGAGVPTTVVISSLAAVEAKTTPRDLPSLGLLTGMILATLIVGAFSLSFCKARLEL